MSNLTLQQITDALLNTPPQERKVAVDAAMKARGNRVWLPNVGSQTDALLSEADELFFGGKAGGGKSDLVIGLALTEHEKSLIIRRYRDDARKLAERMMEIAGTRIGFNGQELIYRFKNRVTDFGGCKDEDDKQRYKGDPHDLIGIDEVTDLLETQYVFIIAWNRSVTPGQRCRVVATGNPPTTAAGLWVIKRWAAWLDPNHPNPAKPGELRWYVTAKIDGREMEVEVDGPGPHTFDEEPHPVMARSRTFIPSELSDNPDLADTNYGAVLDALPPELRKAYRDGRFDSAFKDEPMQLIPSAWVDAAQKRWRPEGHEGLALTAMAVDPAGGGDDPAAIAKRYGGWYAPLVLVVGPDTKDGSKMAGHVVAHRQDNAPIVVDVGGGYAGGMILRMEDNAIPHIAFNGANASTAKTKDGKLKFRNKRAEAYWKLREELDPDQQGGSVIALPVDGELRADLTAMTWELGPQGIQMVKKEDLRETLGRSTNKGDVVAMALSEGDRAVMRARAHGANLRGKQPQVVRGRVAKTGQPAESKPPRMQG